MAKKPPTEFYQADTRKGAGKAPPPEVAIALDAARREALDPASVEKKMRESKVAKARELVDKKPDAALAILRRWLDQR